jgi:hypothetical protein
MPRHDSTEPLWLPILGPVGWHLTATGIQVSIDGGASWHNASVDASTAQALWLANHTQGTRAWISVPIPDLAPTADANVQATVRLTNGADSPVMTAAGRTYFE